MQTHLCKPKSCQNFSVYHTPGSLSSLSFLETFDQSHCSFLVVLETPICYPGRSPVFCSCCLPWTQVTYCPLDPPGSTSPDNSLLFFSLILLMMASNSNCCTRIQISVCIPKSLVVGLGFCILKTFAGNYHGRPCLKIYWYPFTYGLWYLKTFQKRHLIRWFLDEKDTPRVWKESE